MNNKIYTPSVQATVYSVLIAVACSHLLNDMIQSFCAKDNCKKTLW